MLKFPYFTVENVQDVYFVTYMDGTIVEMSLLCRLNPLNTVINSPLMCIDEVYSNKRCLKHVSCCK